MTIISLILIYLTIINIYLYNKQKKKSLAFKSWSQYFTSLFIIFIFIFIFVFFVRFLNFFRETKNLDLNFFFANYSFFNLVVFFIFFFSLKKLVFFFFKTSFLKMHYFYLAPENNSFYVYYYNFYVYGVYNFCVKYYRFFFFIDKILFLLLFFIFSKDILYNNLILDQTLNYLKFYGFFKLIYIVLKFISKKQDLSLDYYLFNLYYQSSVRIDEGYFADTLSQRYYEVTEYENNVLKS